MTDWQPAMDTTTIALSIEHVTSLLHIVVAAAGITISATIIVGIAVWNASRDAHKVINGKLDKNADAICTLQNSVSSIETNIEWLVKTHDKQ